MPPTFKPNRGGAPTRNSITNMHTFKTNANVKKETKRLLKWLAPFKLQIFLVFLLTIVSVVFSVAGPSIMALATNELAEGVKNIIKGLPANMDYGYIGKVLLGLLGLYVISAIFSGVQAILMSNISTQFAFNIRTQVMKKINKLPLSFLSQASQGNVLSIITNDIDTIEASLSQSLIRIVSSTVTLVGITVMMFLMNWQMALVVILITPLSFVNIMILVKLSQKHFKNNQNYLGKVNGHVEEDLSANSVVTSFNLQDKVHDEFEKDNQILREHSFKAEFLSGLLYPSNNFIGNLGYVAVCIVGAIRAASGAITIGDIQAFMMYVRNFSHPITEISNISSTLQRMAAASERVFGILDADEETAAEKLLSLSDIDIKGEVEFRHVKFGYNPEKTIIEDFSAKAEPGQMVAIVGPTGAGKTTLVKLLMRFYDLNGGEILLDGHDIAGFDRHEVRNYFGMVLQDTWLFSGTIMENIRYGRLDATDEEVIEAAKTAQADHFISALPKGYQQELDEDSSNLSQGQKQLITIARAILADPKVLILDEATSSVDTRTEVLIQEAIDKLLKGRTSFIIAHRLSTIRNADLILVIDNGDIIEQGNHEELLAKNGFYANLYNSQFSK
ncbi:MAG: ABC transporter ATP-binding protein [Dehalococcoidales bacterium]|nr:ABC transporter ATP-binding protein [Dehalococcoidales bacterium]